MTFEVVNEEGLSSSHARDKSISIRHILPDIPLSFSLLDLQATIGQPLIALHFGSHPVRHSTYQSLNINLTFLTAEEHIITPQHHS